VQEVVVASDYLATADLVDLHEIADQVGVGYDGLDEDALRRKLMMEGTPVL
jgi:hypothetical protein